MLGAQLGGYRLVSQIGEGGMGAVYLAEHLMLGRRAAIKVLRPEFGQRQDIVQRFFNEARAATAISDPGIVQIFDYGHAADGSAFIVMELLEGEPLDQRLKRIGAFAVADALRIMRQIAVSLGAAHERGIVHRDLKPENIFLCRDAEVPGGERTKVLDFGIAKLGGDLGSKPVVTKASLVMGTPNFMSPEQCRGAGAVDQRSDVYALGCLLCTLVTGAPPFAGATGELIVKHMCDSPPAPSSRVPSIPPELDRLVAICLDKDPSRRFESGTALARAIDELLARGSLPRIEAPTVVARPGSSSMPTTLSGGSMSVPVSAVHSSRRGGVIVGVAVGLIAVGGGVAWYASSDRSPAAPAVAAAPPAPPPPPSIAAAEPAAKATPADQARPAIESLLRAFATWADAHPSAACPTSETLGAAPDPWGTALSITCTDQPGDQRIGVISAGPDRTPGTADDIRSWMLGDRVSALVAGARYQPVAVAERPAAKPATVKKQPPRKKPAGKPGKTKPGYVDIDGDGIPDER